LILAVHRGKRSVEAQLRREQKRAAKRYAIETSFHDRLIKEVVETVTAEQIGDHLQVLFNAPETPIQFFPENAGFGDGVVLYQGVTFEWGTIYRDPNE
jgi:hypothetical protein